MTHRLTKVYFYKKCPTSLQQTWHFLGESWTQIKSLACTQDKVFIYEMRFYPDPRLFQLNRISWNGQMYTLLHSVRRLPSGDLVLRVKGKEEEKYDQCVA